MMTPTSAIPATKKPLDPAILAHLEALSTGIAAKKDAVEAARHLSHVLTTYPAEKSALRAKKDTEALVVKIDKDLEATRKVVRAYSAKTMPPALKKLGNASLKLIAERLVDPTQVTAIPWVSQTWQKLAVFHVILRVKASDLPRGVPYIEVTLDARGDVPTLGATEPAVAPTPAVVAATLAVKLVGWSGLKGETEAAASRKTIYANVERALLGCAKYLGHDVGNDRHTPPSDYREVSISYRSGLPKEGAYSVGECAYDEMEGKEIQAATAKLKSATHPWADRIEHTNVSVGEKGWVYLTVTLK
jgi:hypothetical protein